MNKMLYQGPKFTTLHEQYSKKGRIDHQAPIKSNSEILINASIEEVWKVVHTIKAWEDFNPDFRKINILNLIPDANFSFELNRFKIQAKFAAIKPLERLSWTGKSLWANAVDIITLEVASTHQTKLKIEESLSGVFMSLFMDNEKLKQQHLKWLNSIKIAVEQKVI